MTKRCNESIAGHFPASGKGIADCIGCRKKEGHKGVHSAIIVWEDWECDEI